jgi:hypothetical protein
MTKNPRDHSSRLRDDPQCPGCNRTMRLVGREQQTKTSELLTFECSDCRHQLTHDH